MRSPEPGRVGYVLKMYPRLSETFIVTEMLAHEAAGLDLEIISLRPPVDGRFHEALSRVRAPVTYLPHGRIRASELWSTMNASARRFPGLWDALGTAMHDDETEVHQALHLAAFARDRGLTHLHAHFASTAASVARLAGRIADIPFSFTAHAKDIFHESVDSAGIRQKLREAQAVVTVSDFNVTFLHDEYGTDASGVRRIYNGLDLDEFHYTPPAEPTDTILGVGRLVEKKGFEDLIDACSVLAARGRSFRCEIVGDGALAGALAARIAERGLQDRVVLLGSKPRGEVIARMQAAAAVAAPCIVGDDGNRDGLPTVLLEAMALGTPCLSTNVTGIPEVVRDGETGIIVPQHDASALADGLERLLDDRGLARRLADGARALIEERFDIHRNTADMRRLFSATPAAPEATVGVA